MANVGDVLDLDDIQPVIQQDASDEVGQEECPEVADVGEAVHRGAAGVHPDQPGLEGLNGTDGATEGIVEAEGHRAEAGVTAAPRNSMKRSLTREQDPRYRMRGLAPYIVPPARRREALSSFPHTPAMRQWACVVALLLGFAGDGYVWAARPRLPIPIERQISPDRRDRRTVLMPDWWRR